jgi:hypothetical protein
MTAAQVQNLRNKINAAWNANDRGTADKLQAKLHKHFTATADKFVNSKAGQKHMDNMMARP